jgi:hypothetical protein
MKQKTDKIEGIRSVDFRIIAKGHGVVNWNGSTRLNIDGHAKAINNHTLPKLRGYSNITYINDKDTKQEYAYKNVNDIDFKKTPLYISQNCIRHHLFKENSFLDFQSKEVHDNVDKLLCSIVGLVRGYVIPTTKEQKRTSALLLEDFVDVTSEPTGNFEQMCKAGTKEKKENKQGKEASISLFSKTTFGDTLYNACGSISIEQLQFISLDGKFSREAMNCSTEKDKKALAKKMTEFLNGLGGTDKAEAIYHKNYVRNGSIYDIGEAGILVNDVAIDILVKKTLDLLENLTIRQAKGYMYVDSIEIDYNDSSKAKDMMRIKRIEEGNYNIKKEKGSLNYAQYFVGV